MRTKSEEKVNNVWSKKKKKFVFYGNKTDFIFNHHYSSSLSDLQNHIIDAENIKLFKICIAIKIIPMYLFM